MVLKNGTCLIQNALENSCKIMQIFTLLKDEIMVFQSRQQEIAAVILKLDMTWKKFLNCASSSATDFLSIDHLGMILDVLYQNGIVLELLKNILKSPFSNVFG